MSRLLIALSFALLAPLHAQQWFTVAGDNFTLYTQDPAHTRDTVGEFERARAFFNSTHQLMPALETSRPVLLLAIPTEAEFARYRIGQTTTAYFLSTDDFDGVVMGPVAQKERRAAVHEYVHLRIQRAGLKIPVWLNEGLAEYYSTLKFERTGKVSTGETIPQHLKNLNSSWIPFGALFALGSGSSAGFYQHAQLALTAYSECWATAHMLLTVEPWRSKSNALLAALTRGATTQQAFEEVYHASIQDVEQAVREYTRRWSTRLITYDVAAYKEAVDAQPQPVDDYTVSYALAASFPDRARRIAALTGVVERYPKRPEPRVTLAYQLWRDRGITSALPSFQAAYENGTDNTQALWDYGKQLLNMRDPRCLELLQRAAKAWPERDDVRFLIGQWHLMNRHWDEAAQAFSTVKQPPQGQDIVYYEALVVAYAETGQYPRAKEALTKLGALNLTPDQRNRFELYKKRIGE